MCDKSLSFQSILVVGCCLKMIEGVCVCVVLVFEGKPKPSLLEFSICIHDPMRRAAARGQAALERETQGVLARCMS